MPELITRINSASDSLSPIVLRFELQCERLYSLSVDYMPPSGDRTKYNSFDESLCEVCEQCELLLEQLRVVLRSLRCEDLESVE